MFASGEKQSWAEPSTIINENSSTLTTNQIFKRMNNK
jgi:hypothetical protein